MASHIVGWQTYGRYFVGIIHIYLESESNGIIPLFRITGLPSCGHGIAGICHFKRSQNTEQTEMFETTTRYCGLFICRELIKTCFWTMLSHHAQ